jgi:hypothetical protein
MKPLKLALTIAALPLTGVLLGCSANSDTEENPDLFPQNLTEFTLDDYRVASESTDQNSLIGTWVGVTDIQYTYFEQEGSDPVEDPRTFESRREFMVIRKETNSDDLEISSCNGGFRSVTAVSADSVATFRGNFTRGSNNSLLIPSVSTSGEDEDTKISVTAVVSGEFIKIADTTGALGSANWNWADIQGEVFSEDIFCAGLNNLEGGNQKISVGMKEGSSLLFSQESFVAQTDLVFDDTQTNKRHTAEDLPEDFSFEISDSDSSGLSFTFSIQNTPGNTETVVGSGNFSVTLP